MKNALPRAAALALLAQLAAAQAPRTYCTAGTSTNGCTPAISANVQPNTAHNSGCVITASGVEGQKLGIVFYGIDNAGFAPLPWGSGSTSFRCVKPPVKRVGAPQDSGGVAGQCNGAFTIQWDAYQAANASALGNPWYFGDKVFVQAWFRDPLAPSTSNLSNALELTYRHPTFAPCVTAIPGMVMIPAGSFTMGSNVPSGLPYFNDTISRPAHSVTITYCFWMAAKEVTQAQYAALMGSNPSFYVGANKPVERVTWLNARDYCLALNAQQAALGGLPSGYEYRLPTEAEREYACRAGTTTEFNMGAAIYCNQARFGFSQHSYTSCGNSGPLNVGSYAPNAWGLHDMHGNVAEWCLDVWRPYAAGSLTDPFVGGGLSRVVRGGGWGNTSDNVRSADRPDFPENWATDEVGFRVVLAPILAP